MDKREEIQQLKEYALGQRQQIIKYENLLDDNLENLFLLVNSGVFESHTGHVSFPEVDYDQMVTIARELKEQYDAISSS